MRETAHAKINLALHVRAREPDGYHRIETIFAFAEDGDELSATPAATLELRIEGPFAAGLECGPDNLVMAAAAALRRRFGVTEGAAILLDKGLPVASGIGGGSADAAAALRLLARLWGIDAPAGALHQIAASLGADVPACLVSRTMRGEGRGDELRAVEATDLAGTPLLLVNPGVPVPTGAVFAGWNGRDLGPLAGGDPLAAALKGRNDLEAPAVALAPAIGEVLAALAAQPGVRLSRMSGSGATCFALFDSGEARDAAASIIASAQPLWWQLATRVR
jgi:4-diphosphocytidyl-2-C-methyl-D-erythritol kinase